MWIRDALSKSSSAHRWDATPAQAGLLPRYYDFAKASAGDQAALLKPVCPPRSPHTTGISQGQETCRGYLASSLDSSIPSSVLSASYRKESHREGGTEKQPWPSCPQTVVKGPGLQCTPSVFLALSST